MAAPAATDRARMSSSSSSVNCPPPSFSARYRLPNTWSRMRTGTPRKLCIGGWWGGKPYARGWAVMSGSRIGCGSSMSRPSTPWPCGSSPIRRWFSSLSPCVMKSVRVRSAPTTPKAP